MKTLVIGASTKPERYAYKAIERLKAKGFTVLNEQPKAGADNKRVAFLHPKSSNGVLVELCEERG